MSRARWSTAGWMLFFVSGLFFLSDAIQSGDLTVWGSSITWLIGVVFFVLAERNPSDDDA